MSNLTLEKTLIDMYEESIYVQSDSHIEEISVIYENNGTPKERKVIEEWLMGSIRQ